MRHKVFVYGSLRKGMWNAHLLAKETFLGPAMYPPGHARMVSLGSFPALVQDERGPAIFGELYEVSSETFRALDRLEGYPRHYQRYKVKVHPHGDMREEVRAWVYVQAKSTANEVKCGDWVLHKALPVKPLLALIAKARAAKSVDDLPLPEPPKAKARTTYKSHGWPWTCFGDETVKVILAMPPGSIANTETSAGSKVTVRREMDGNWRTISWSTSNGSSWGKDELWDPPPKVPLGPARPEDTQPLFTEEELKPRKKAEPTPTVSMPPTALELSECDWCGETVVNMSGDWFGWDSLEPDCLASPCRLHEPRQKEVCDVPDEAEVH